MRSVPLAAILAWAVPAACWTLSATHVRPPRSASISTRRWASPAGTSGRKDAFWREVAFGLAARHSLPDVKRVLAFGQYARGAQALPDPPLAPGHEPCEEFVPGLAALPWHDPATFPWVAGLEAQAAVIQEELAAALAADASSFSGDSALQTQVMGSGWSALRLQRMGQWNAAACARFPNTVALLQALQVPTAMRGVMFARQAPGSRVARHSDGRNFVLTLHLGLQVPAGGVGACWVECGGVRRGWAAGQAVVLDTSFAHETANLSGEERHVLIVDFWHPGLTAPEQEALKFVYDLRYEYDKELIS